MKSIKKIGKNDILLTLIALSSFFTGGEALEFKFGIPLLALVFLFLDGAAGLGRKEIAAAAGTALLLLYNIFSGNISSDMFNTAIFIWGFIALASMRFTKRLFETLIISSAFIHSSVVFHQYFFSSIHRPASTFVNPNWTSLWIFAGLYILLRKRGMAIALRIPAAVLMAAALYLERSRTIVLLLAMAAVWMILRQKRKTAIFAAAALIILSAVIGTVRFKSDIRDSLAFSRWKIYSASFRMAADRPLIGHGFATVDDKLPGYAGRERREYSNYSVTPKMSHSVYLEIILSAGLAGLLLFIWFLSGRLRVSRYRGLLILFMAAAMFNNIEKSFSLVLLTAVLLSFGKNTESEHTCKRDIIRAIPFLAIIFYFLTLQYAAYRSHLKAVDLMDQGRPEKAGKYYVAACRMDPAESFYYREYAMYILTSAEGIAWDDKTALVEELCRENIRFAGNDPESYYFRSYFYNVILRSGNFRLFKPEINERALADIDHALRLNPNNVNYLYEKMLFYAYKGDIAMVTETWHVLLSKEKYHFRSYQLMETLSDNPSLRETAARKMEEIRMIRKSASLNGYEKSIMSE